MGKNKQENTTPTPIAPIEGENRGNEGNPAKQKETEGEKEPLARSYVERALSDYARKAIYGGYTYLKGNFPLIMAYIVTVVIVAISTLVIYLLDNPWLNGYITLEVLQRIIYLGTLNAVGLIVSGIIGGIFKKQVIMKILTICTILLSIFFSIWSPTYLPDHLLINWSKFTFFMLYALITSISIFFLILSFHASLSYRIVSLGKAPQRMFFQTVIRAATFFGIFMYAYLALQGDIYQRILAGMGIIVSIMLILRFSHHGKFDTKAPFEEKEDYKAGINLKQVIGFYNLYLLYQLSQSFNTGGSVGNIAVDVVLLITNVLYIINRLSSRVEIIGDLDEEAKKHFKFKKNTGIFMKIKASAGEESLIIIAMGIALGYIMVVLDSFLGSPLPVITEIAGDTTPLNVVLHQMILLIAQFLILYVFIKKSYFKDLAMNRYSFKHVFKMFSDLFKRGEDGETSPIGIVVEQSKQNLLNWGKSLFKKRDPNQQ